MKIDLSRLSPVTASKRKKPAVDLQYLPKYEKWRVSDLAFARMDLSNNGINLMLSPDGYVVLQLVPEADAQLMKRRKNSTTKGRDFKSPPLRTLLDSKFEGVNKFCLTDLGQQDGFSFVGIEEHGSSMIVETTTKVEVEVEEDDDATTEMVEAVAAEAEAAGTIEDVEDITPIGEMEDPEVISVDETDDTEDTNFHEDENLDLEDIPETDTPVKNPFSSF